MSWPYPAFAALCIALILERLVGYPQPLHRLIGHPVEWAGRLIELLDRSLNRPEAPPEKGRQRGIAALAILLAAAFAAAWLVAKLLALFPFGVLLEAIVASAFLAQHSLRQHVAAVGSGLNQSLEAGRRAVAHIVGRDPAGLEEQGVARGALESLAENTSDGVVAPALWYGLLGLPGLVLYKAINTADSMIGHRDARHLHFGWAAARLDDLVNLPASRLTALLFGLASGPKWSAVLRAALRDGPKHNSPNAGWPEAALATALGLRLGGPRDYDGETVDLPEMGDGNRGPVPADIARGLRLYGRALTLLLALAALAVVLS
ncbi:MAG: cobalamin biosynthesis protein CobD [Alphaproteobacteria bacterium]|nr:cobalamin biosynthesis protein CobD [Alphaproteobacteria bacterium]